jgi:hypothetical protein
MPTRQSRLTKTEDREYRSQLLQLGDMGIPTGHADNASPEPERFAFEQIDHGFARLYELPAGAVAVVAPARLTVWISGPFFTHRIDSTLG